MGCGFLVGAFYYGTNDEVRDALGSFPRPAVARSANAEMIIG